MSISKSLKEIYIEVSPHVNGHHTLMNKFINAINEVEKMEALIQNNVVKNEVEVCKHVKVEVDDDGLGNTHYCSKCREWNF